MHNPLRLPRKTTCFVHFDLETCFAPQRRALFRHLNLKKWPDAVRFLLGNVLRATTACTFSTSQLPKVSKSGLGIVCFVHFDLEMCFAHLRATRACTFSTSQLPKVAQEWCALYILTWKRASRHNGVHFFDISTFKSIQKWSARIFAPQRRALFRHLNFQKYPKVVWEWCALYILTWKCASRQNSVQLFISRLLFDPLEPQIIGKTQRIRTFVHFRAPASSFFSLFLLSDLLASFLLLSGSSHLCFSICPYLSEV